MKIPFHNSAPPAVELRTPAPARLPSLKHTSVTALYRGVRVGGDFFEFAETHGRVVFILLDIAGKREGAFHIAATVQDRFRQRVPELFNSHDLNDANALSELTIDLNRTLIQAAEGVRCAPAFVATYDDEMGMLQYVNAGHHPGLVRDASGVSTLEPNGLPLGLFSHATHDAQFCVLQPGAALVLPSKGLVEARRNSHEFGIDGIKEFVAHATFADARELGSNLLKEVEEQVKRGLQNDMTVVALVRAVAAGATVGT